MEVVVSAVTGDLFSRFISFLMNKFLNQASLEEKVERLQLLLLRVKIVVDEADGRYITNGGMLIQLNMLVKTMYQGYHALDTIMYRQHNDDGGQQVSDSATLSFPRPLKRFRTTAATTNKIKDASNELQTALDNLEVAIANMAELVLLLGGCERMPRRPYDAYLYIDNFMFGRHAEKQQVRNILLQDNPLGTPTVLPIIGDLGVGKKTLVAHVCNDEKVNSSFSSILHLNGDDFWRIDNQKLKINKTLVFVVLCSNVSDNKWAKFYSSVTQMGRGSKVILVGSIEILGRFGTVKPIYLNRLSDQEFSYLFKTLAFGSAKPEENPQLASIAQGFVTTLRGSLIGAHVLRKNVNPQFWLSVLEMLMRMVQRNFYLFGEHPKILLGRRQHPIEILYSAASPPLQVMSKVPKIGLPKVTLGELVGDPTLRPKGEFNLVTWESKIPPYAKFVHYVPACSDDNPEISLHRKKRQQQFV